jgi:hypothetical protein
MNNEAINAYAKGLEEHIFLMMQLLKQDYLSIILMPIDRFHGILKRKFKFDEEVQKLQEEEFQKAQRDIKRKK